MNIPDTSNGLLTAFTSLFVGVLLQAIEPHLMMVDIPPMLMHTFQLIAWSVSIFAGALSIYNFFKKKNGKKSNKKTP